MKTKREILLEYVKSASCGEEKCGQCQYYYDKTCTSCSLVRDKLIRIGAMAVLRMFPKKREFDINNVLTCVTADKAKVGMKGYFGDNLEFLRTKFEEKDIRTLTEIRDESYGLRFREKIDSWALFYPLNEVEE
jgi:hypothetical protein